MHCSSLVGEEETDGDDVANLTGLNMRTMTMTDDWPTNTTPMHITITTYNLVSACKEQLLTALRAMADLNMDIAILTETKLVSDQYTKQGFRYHMFATSAASPSQGGIALIW